MPGIRLSTTNRSKDALAELPLRLARAGRFDDLVPLVPQRASQPLEDLLLVVGQQNRAADAHATSSAVSGRSSRISVPSPTRLVTVIVPPRPSMMFLAIGRPSPVPFRRVVKYGSKMWTMSSALMPVPESCTVMATRPAA